MDKEILIRFKVAGEAADGMIPVHTIDEFGFARIVKVPLSLVVQDVSQRVERQWDSNTRLFVVPKVKVPAEDYDKLSMGIIKLLNGETRCVILDYPVNIYTLKANE